MQYEATMTQHDTTGQYTRDLANELSIDASVALGPITCESRIFRLRHTIEDSTTQSGIRRIMLPSASQSII